jgi:hypothetical protein
LRLSILSLPQCRYQKTHSYFWLAKWAWYAFQPGHQPVCQRQSRANKDLGLASAFFRIGQVSQVKVFSEGAVFCVFIVFSPTAPPRHN